MKWIFAPVARAMGGRNKAKRLTAEEAGRLFDVVSRFRIDDHSGDSRRSRQLIQRHTARGKLEALAQAR